MIAEGKEYLNVMLLNNSKTRLVLVVALLAGMATAGAGTTPGLATPLFRAHPEKPTPLTVTVKPEKTHVRPNEQFAVRLRVVNTSRTAQSFQVMNCSWDEHWQSSNKQVSWFGWDCSKNSAMTETLKPGQAYERRLSMLVVAGAPKGKVSFKMGFTPIGSKRTYWSKAVSVQLDAVTR